MTETKKTKPGGGDESLAEEILASEQLKDRAIVFDEDGNILSDTSFEAERRRAAKPTGT